MATKRSTRNVASDRPVGPAGHRDEDERFEARKEAWRLHEMEGWSLRDIAIKQGTVASTVKNDIDWYRRYLQGELPETFEAWRTKITAMYKDQYAKAEELYKNAKSSFVQAQAVKLMQELTNSIADLYGVPKGVEAPRKAEEPAEDEISWN
jgi:hypothetical protein